MWLFIIEETEKHYVDIFIRDSSKKMWHLNEKKKEMATNFILQV